MRIEKVKVRNIDDFGARTLEVRTDKITFSTPSRAVTSTEANYKKRVRTLDDPYENPVFEVISHFTPERIKLLYTKNGVFGQRKSVISSYVRGFEDVITKFFPQMRKEYSLNKDDIFTFLDLQRYCDLDLISIPDYSPNSDPGKYEDLITKASENFIFNYTNAEPIPYVDMASEPEIFQKKVDMILDHSGIFKVMGVIYRSPLQYYPNFKYLRDKAENDIWIHASGVPRYYGGNWTTSQIHIPQIYSIDTYSLRSQMMGVEPPIKPVDEIRRFDYNTLGLLKIKDHRRRYGSDLDCDCPVCSNKNLDDLIANYTIDHKGQRQNALLDTWCKIHEVYSSSMEFERSKDAINNNEFEKYIRGKEYMKNLVDDFR